MRGLRIHFPAILLSLGGSILAYGIMGASLRADRGDLLFHVLWTGATLAGFFLLSALAMWAGLRFLGKYRVDLPKGWWKRMLLALICLFLLGCLGQYLYHTEESTTQTVQGDADVVLLIDASGSMDGNCLLAAKDAASQFVDILNSNTRLQIIPFAGWVLDDTGLVFMDAAGKANAKSFISTIDSTGATDFNTVLQCAIDSLNTNARAGAKPMVILMTDGQDYVEDSVKNQYYSSGVPVYSVQICDTTGDRDLVQFAQQSGGFDTQIDPASVDASRLLDGFRNALDDTVTISYETDRLLLDDDVMVFGYHWSVRFVVMCLCYVICAVGFYGMPSKRILLLRLLVGACVSAGLGLVSDYESVMGLYMLLINTAYVLVRPSAEVEINV